MNNPLTSPRTKRAANVLGIVLLIALVAPFAVFAVPEVVGADESFVVLTASMTPAIAPGDVVVVAERDPAAIAEGDVITFSRGTSDVPVTHRVIDIVDEGGALAFETKGDANEGPDPGLVPAANLVGAVTLTIPYIGYVIQFAGTRVGFVALVLLPFGLLAVTEVWSAVNGRSETPASAAAGSVDNEAETTDDDATTTDDGTTSDTIGAGDAAVASDLDAAADDGRGVSVDTVGGAAAVLGLFAPYAVYVAVELRTAAAIAVAIGTTTLLFGALAMWVPASGVLDRNGPTSNPDDAETLDSGAGDSFDAAEATEPEPEPADSAPEPGESTAAVAADAPAPPNAPATPLATDATEEGS